MIEITFKCDTIDSAEDLIKRLRGAPAHKQLLESHKHNGVVQDVAVQEQAKPVEQTAPAPQPEAPVGKTVQDCIAAFQRYVAKGNGRSAGKFMNEVMGPKYGARSIGQVASDRLGELYADFEAA